MIALTGAGGFIGSVILGYLNKQGIKDVCLFDDLPIDGQVKNLIGKQYNRLYSVDNYSVNVTDFDAVIHFGANSSTLEKNWENLYETNVISTRKWHNLCADRGIKFIYASSAAVYGNGNGPLNHYAFSKLSSEQEIINGVILRLFNVYGPNEYHKGRMASTPYHWFNQLHTNKKIEVFDHSKEYFRDFIYVEDVVRIVYQFLNNYKEGIYDLGTGRSISFDYLADQCLANKHGQKIYIPIPKDLVNQYQKNTCAITTHLENVGIDVNGFITVEDGIKEYFKYLNTTQFY